MGIAGYCYIEQFTGSFKSALRWHDLDRLWETLRRHNQGRWYLYQIGETPPEITSTHEDLDLFINEIDDLLHEEHDEDYCGIVYADNLQEPSMIKIFTQATMADSGKFYDRTGSETPW